MEFDERRYRPLSTVDLFDEAFDLYKRNFVLFLLIVSFVVVPSTVLTDIFTLKWLNDMGNQLGGLQSSNVDTETMVNSLGEALKQSAIGIAFYIPPWALVFSALTAAISARYLEKPITLWQSYVVGFRRYLSSLIATIVFMAALFSGSIFVLLAVFYPDLASALLWIGIPVGVIVCLIVSARYSLYLGATVTEKLGPFKALARSAALTKTDTGRVIWAVICLNLIVVAIFLILEEVLEIFTGLLTIPALVQNKIVAADVGSGLAILILTPFMVVVMNLLYFDQRVRKEGFDMEILAERLGYRPIAIPSQATYTPVLTKQLKKGKK